MTNISLSDGQSQTSSSSVSLAANQQLILLAQQQHPDTPLYQMCHFYEISGKIEVVQFQQAFENWIRDTDVLRTVSADRQWTSLRISSLLPAECEFQDLRMEKCPADCLERKLAERIQTPLVVTETLYDSILFQMTDSDFCWLFRVHHLLTDGENSRQMLQSLADHYTALRDETTVARRSKYQDCLAKIAADQLKPIPEPRLDWWSRRSETPLQNSFFDVRSTTHGVRHSRVEIEVCGEMARAIRELETRTPFRQITRGLTSFSIFGSTLMALLWRLQRADLIRIGATTHGRSFAEAREAVGLFMQVLPFQIEFDDHDTFENVARKMSQESRGFLQHAVNDVTTPQMARSFDVALNVLDFSVGKFASFPASMKWLHNGYGDEQLKLAVSFCQSVGDRPPTVIFDFNDAVFNADQRERFVGYFERLLVSMADDPSTSIANVDFLGASERDILTQSVVFRKQDTLDVNVWNRFRQTAGSHANVVAVDDANCQLTYAQTLHAAGVVARQLEQHRCGPVIPVICRRDANAVVGMLGVLAAKRCFLPIDATLPADRISTLLRNAGSVTAVDAQNDELRIVDCEVQPDGVQADQLATQACYAISTSGSTGQPNCVLVGHASLLNFLANVERLAALPLGACSWFTSVGFDVSIYEMFTALLYGRTLLIPSDGCRNDPEAFVQWMEARGVTSAYLPAPYLPALLAATQRGAVQNLRRLLVGVEPISQRLLAMIGRHVPALKVVNGYGPTEATICATLAVIDETDLSESRASIGRPVDGNVARVVDASGQLVPQGVTGELLIGGAGLALGYLHNPTLTNERFRTDVDDARAKVWYRTGDQVRWRTDGNLEFVGRKDRQLKIRGHRIEPLEIEAALQAHPAVAEGLVMPADAGGNTDQKRLVAYYTSSVDVEASADEDSLRVHLQNCLPHYMVPNALVQIPVLPYGVDGKVDRSKLPPPVLGSVTCESHAGHVASDTERRLCKIWQEVLGIDSVHTQDSFFALGGDSISAIQIVARAAGVGINFSAADVLNNVTIHQLAASATNTATDAATDGHSCVGRTGDVPLTPIQVWFFAREFHNQDQWNQSMRLRLPIDVDTLKLERTIEQLIQTHEALRLRFSERGGCWTASIDERGTSRFSLTPPAAEAADGGLNRQAIALVESELNASLDISVGRLVAASVVSDEQENRLLLLAIHHLCADAFSWQILLEDLSDIYRDLSSGRALQMSVEHRPCVQSHSFREWAVKLQDWATTDVCAEEAKLCRGLNHADTPRSLPIDMSSDGENLQRLSRTLTFFVSHDDLAADGGDVVGHAAMQCRIIAALVQAVAEWSGSPSVRLMLESHGRHEFSPSLDTSRTVGWFTNLYPITVDVGSSPIVNSALTSVTETLQRVPRGGLAFGLQHNDSHDSHREAPASLDMAPEILFNYFGTSAFRLPEASLIQSCGELQLHRSADCRRPYLWEINVSTDDKGVSIAWEFSRKHHRDETIRRLGQALLSNLKNADDPYPLTPLQQGMLVHSIADRDSGVYVQQLCTRIIGNLNRTLFTTAWRDVVNRHGALRTAFLWQNLDHPLQVVRGDADVPWKDLDWRGQNQDDRRALKSTFLQQDRRDPFDLAKAPLMRMTLIQEGDAEWLWIWTFHHLLCDGWSVAVIRDEFQKCYRARCQETAVELPPVVKFRDHAARISAQDNIAAEAYWKSRFSDFAEVTTIQCEGTQSADSEHRQEHVRLSESQTRSLNAFARSSNLTLNTVVHGAWTLLLSRFGRSSDVVYGATVSGRAGIGSGMEHAVGMYINTLPVKNRIDDALLLHDWLQQLQTDLLESRAFEQFALADIQRLTSVQGDLFESILVFENYPSNEESPACDEVEFCTPEYHEQSNYPLALLVVPGEELEFQLIYDRQRFTPSVASEILSSMAHLLDQFARQTNSLLAAYSVCDSNSIDSRTAPRPHDREVESETVCSLISAHVRQAPNRTALTDADVSLTYAELDQLSRSVASHLSSHGVAAGHRVAICCPRSLHQVVGILGILQAGAAYVPLDPASPFSRLQTLLQDASVSAVVCFDEDRPKFAKLGYPIVAADDCKVVENPLCRTPSDSNAAYLIYTSGSTGRPKAVQVSHRALYLSTMARMAHYEQSPQRFLLLSPAWFDSSVAGIFWTLCSGGTLVLPSEKLVRDVHQLVQYLSRHQVTHTLCLPSYYQLLMKHAQREQLVSLSTVIVAGESCSPSVVRRHFQLLPTVELWNEYGPTEASVWATVGRLTAEDIDDGVSIGTPAPGCQIDIIDPAGHCVPDGIVGEIIVGGNRLADGYPFSEAETARRFVRRNEERVYLTGDLGFRRSDGKIVFVGREDSQFKVNGQRLEVAEIEAALQEIDGVHDVAVTVVDLHSDAAAPQYLIDQLSLLPVAEAENLLAQAESIGAESHVNGSETVQHLTSEVDVNVSFLADNFIDTPKPGQRKWLIEQALAETAADLNHLNRIATQMVPGSDQPHVPRDLSNARLTDQEIMEDWQSPLMRAMADFACDATGDVLEIGFGRGVAATHIQNAGVKSHTVVEMNPHSVDDFFVPWRQQHADRDIRLLQGRWQDVLDTSHQFDAVFFHAFPMNESEFMEYIANSVTFAEHFFSTAAQLLRPGGVFTYMTTEIDSISRRHQRALFQHFAEIHMKLQPLNVPADTRDAWWVNSMVVLKALRATR